MFPNWNSKSWPRTISHLNGISRLRKNLKQHFFYIENKEWQKAIRRFEECPMINKRNAQSYGNLGICYAQLGRKSEAFTALDKAFEIDPQYKPAIVNKFFIKSIYNKLQGRQK